MTQLTPDQAKTQLDTHLRDIVAWHFAPETGCPFWLEWAGKNFDPRKEINTIEDMKKFPHFQDEWLRDLQPEVWVRAIQGQALQHLRNRRHHRHAQAAHRLG